VGVGVKVGVILPVGVNVGVEVGVVLPVGVKVGVILPVGVEVDVDVGVNVPSLPHDCGKSRSPVRRRSLYDPLPCTATVQVLTDQSIGRIV
jgi:hypothetical protein